MVKQNYGRIIFIGSGSAKRGGGSLSYTAAKHGLVGMTRALVYQIPTTITVNTLNPARPIRASSISLGSRPIGASIRRLPARE